MITFDTDKKVPLLVKNYKDTISNLVKMRRSRGFTAAAGTWLPGEIGMENFPMRTTSTLTLRWQPTEDVPALFDPAALDKPSTADLAVLRREASGAVPDRDRPRPPSQPRSASSARS